MSMLKFTSFHLTCDGAGCGARIKTAAPDSRTARKLAQSRKWQRVDRVAADDFPYEKLDLCPACVRRRASAGHNGPVAGSVLALILLVSACFAESTTLADANGDASSDEGTGDDTLSPSSASSTSAGTHGPGGSGGGSGTTDDPWSSSDSNGGTSDGESSSDTDTGSSSDAGGSSSTGDPDPTVYADCLDDAGAPLCPGSCVADPEGTASACAPPCGPECPEGGACLDDVADEVAALVCVLPCTNDDECPGMVCADTTYTTGGAPLRLCMWP